MLGLAGAVAGLLALAVAWRLQAATRNGGWLVSIWAFGTGVGGLLAALWPLGALLAPRQVLVAVMIAVWSMRLGLHLAERAALGPEDARFVRLRRQSGGNGFTNRIICLSVGLALIGSVLCACVLVAARNPVPGLAWADAAGVILLGMAVALEALADWQLRHFRADPAHRGQIMLRGFWAWSRHPNYFFQTLGWCAYPVIALGPPGSPWPGAPALLGPVLMYGLLVHVTGIPPLEREMLAARGAAFRAYQATTRAFFPRRPSA